MHCIKVPNVANSDINEKHSNFKTMLRDKTKTPQLVLHSCGYSLSSNLMPCWNIAKQSRTESAIRPATSVSDLRWRRNHDFTVFAVIHSSLGMLNPFRGIMQPFEEIMQPFRGIILPFRGRTHPFWTIMHDTVCCRRTTQSIPSRLYHSSYCGELTLLVE